VQAFPLLAKGGGATNVGAVSLLCTGRPQAQPARMHWGHRAHHAAGTATGSAQCMQAGRCQGTSGFGAPTATGLQRTCSCKAVLACRILLDHLDPNHIFVRKTLAALPEKNTEELSKGRRHVTARDHCARGELFPSSRPAVACHLRPRSTAGRARSTCTRLSVAVDASKSKLPTEPTA